jgi:chorismate mutase/prephenate dehydratase
MSGSRRPQPAAGLQSGAHPLNGRALLPASEMSQPNPTSDSSAPSQTGADDPPAPDGMPIGLPALRAELDRIDDTLHDLLMQRAKVVEHVGRSGKRSAFRPGREASIVRRLVARHHGSLPVQTIFRMWREMLAGTTGMQAPVIVAVCETDAGGAMTQTAREHFGSLTPVHIHRSPARALAEVSTGTASVAVLPYPTDTDLWWTTLLHQEPRVHIIARLPFWGRRTEGAPTVNAVVVAADAPDASGADRSFLCMELAQETSRTRLSSALAAAGLKPDDIVMRGNQLLVEVDGYVPSDDPRLAQLADIGRPVVLGAYAIPVAEGTP